jgi:hypothetical protein
MRSPSVDKRTSIAPSREKMNHKGRKERKEKNERNEKQKQKMNHRELRGHRENGGIKIQNNSLSAGDKISRVEIY